MPYKIENLIPIVLKLDDRAKISFACSICERLFPNYMAFHEDTGQGNPEVLEIGLHRAWSFSGVFGNEMQLTDYWKNRFISLYDECHDLEPDLSEYVSPLTVPAIHAISAVSSLMLYCATGDNKNLKEVMLAMRDTLDSHIAEMMGLSSSEENIESKIESHQLMRYEFVKQQQDLKLLMSEERDIFLLKRRSPRSGFKKKPIEAKGCLGLW